MKLTHVVFAAALGGISMAAGQTTPTTSSSTNFGATTTGTREFTLGASGATDKRISGSNGGASGSFGWYLNEASEVVLRQSVNFSTGNRTFVPVSNTSGGATGTGSGVQFVTQNGRREWDAATRIAFDQHFSAHGTFRPFLGANFGGVYGRSVRDTWAAGLEAGGKFYVQQRTFILVMVEYGWFFKHAHSIDNRFRDGQFTWSAGVGFNF